MSNLPFFVKRNDLSDGSVLFEVRLNGADLRLGSSDSYDKAVSLKNDLNRTANEWQADTANTIDV